MAKKTEVQKETVNMKILAEKLNLSKATVSKALQDSYEISAQTKKRVLELAAQLNYTPNPYASSLRRKKSKTIAVVLPEVADNFFSLAINGIQSVAEKKGYHVLICLSHEKYRYEKQIIDQFLNGRVDGVLISISAETNTIEHIARLQSGNIPVVFFDREFEQANMASVTTNDQECGRLATRHMLDKGCRNLAFLSVSKSLPMCKNRLEGFVTAMKDAGIPKKETRIVYCSGHEKDDLAIVKQLLKEKNRPDGIVASTEKTAILVYLACHELGVRIPQDCRVIAFSTLETAPILNPALTTITQPAFEIGKAAASLLFNGIEKRHFDLSREHVIIPSMLIERTSTL
jgi:LacI family transcriptional regulator